MVHIAMRSIITITITIINRNEWELSLISSMCLMVTISCRFSFRLNKHLSTYRRCHILNPIRDYWDWHIPKGISLTHTLWTWSRNEFRPHLSLTHLVDIKIMSVEKWHFDQIKLSQVTFCRSKTAIPPIYTTLLTLFYFTAHEIYSHLIRFNNEWFHTIMAFLDKYIRSVQCGPVRCRIHLERSVIFTLKPEINNFRWCVKLSFWYDVLFGNGWLLTSIFK